ncbi:MAG: hypothetical protein WC635_03625 [Bacteriovorax sp.]|jgi:hypothetical protein
MRILLPLILLISCANVFACSEVLKLYPEECEIQNRYQKLLGEFSVYSINITDLKGFKIPKAIGKVSYFRAKNDFLNHSEISLSASKEWQVWNNGQKYVNKINPVYLELNEVTKLHKNLFSEKGFLNIQAGLGALRTSNGETNPKIIHTCADKVLNNTVNDLLYDYDLKSIEGYSLLTLENVQFCSDRNFFSGELQFYKGASVKPELLRWVTDMNDMLSRYESGEVQDISPFQYLADMRRWFLAIRPFNFGNEEVVAALVDYAVGRMKLTPVSLNDTVSPIYMNVSENRSATNKKIRETLSFFEGCLFETKTKFVSSECTPLK